MNRALVLVLLFVSALFSSCSFSKLMAGKKPDVHASSWAQSKTDTSHTVVAVLPDMVTPTPSVPIPGTGKWVNDGAPLWAKRLSYTTFSAKARMHMERPGNSEDFTAHIRVRKDSVIWINITAFGGFSFARILITRDSFYMLNNKQRTALRIPLSDAVKILPTHVDFASLQNLVLGEPLRGGAITDVKSAGDTLNLRVEDSSYIQQIAYSRADSNMYTAELRMRVAGGPVAFTNYSSYEAIDTRKISTARILNIKNGNDAYMLEMNITKADFDIPFEFNFSIPQSYSVKK